MLIWRLAWRDLRGSSGGFRLLATALVLAVAAMAAVGSIADGLLQEARASAQQSIGGDVSFRLFHRKPTPAELEVLASMGELGLVAELRTRAARSDGGAGALVELKAIDATYPLYGDLLLDPPGRAQPALAMAADGAWGALVDADLLEALDLELGEDIRLGAITVQVRARIVREPDRALRGFALGPRVIIDQAALAASGLAAPGAAIYWYSRLRLPPGGDGKAAVDAVERQLPHGGWRIVNATDGIPGIERSIALARTVVLALALAMLIIGGLGIAGAVAAHLQAKTATIAILKTLGCTGRQVAGIYITQLLIVAGMATVAGLLLGAMVPALLEAVGIDLPLAGLGPLRLQPKALALAGGMAFAVTLLFALRPLDRAVQKPAMVLLRWPVSRPKLDRRRARAILPTSAAVGLGAALAGLVLLASDLPAVAMIVLAALLAIAVTFAFWAMLLTWLARRASRFLGHAPLIRLALANLSAPAAPTTGTVVALGLGLTCLVAGLAIQATALRHIATTLPATAPDLVWINLPQDAAATVQALAAERLDIARLEIAPFMHASVTHLDGVPVRQTAVPRELAWVIRGDRGVSWPLAATPRRGDRDALSSGTVPRASIAADIAGRLGLAPGHRLTLDVLGAPLEISIGAMHEVDWTRLELAFPILLEPQHEPPPHQLIAAAWLADGHAPASLIRRFEQEFAASPVIRVPEVLARLDGLMAIIRRTLELLALSTLLVALLVLTGGVAAGYRQRAAQAAILLTQGATPRQLAWVGAIELGAIGMLAALPAAAIGSTVAGVVAGRLGPDLWQFDPVIPVAVAGAAPVMLAVVGFVLLPGRRWRHAPRLLRPSTAPP